MASWRSQQFIDSARKNGCHKVVVQNAVAVGRELQVKLPGAPPIFSLRHFAHLTEIDYAFLRRIVTRSHEPYRIFRVRKRPLPGEEERYRVISVPNDRLMAVQRWISAEILSRLTPHEASVAFTKGDNIKTAVQPHCGSRWIIKLDLLNFFESINERQVFHIFRRAGYQPLVAFELARICTRRGQQKTKRDHAKWNCDFTRWQKIISYGSKVMGYLPQGAPTSPRLANLAARDLDNHVMDAASEFGFIYTRYADDLCLSTKNSTTTRSDAVRLISAVYACIGHCGFTPQKAKTRLVPPGARKIVLGLSLNDDRPRLTREFKARIRQHVHFLLRDDVGPAGHSAHLGATTFGLRRHVLGLIHYARHIEPDFGNRMLGEFTKIRWG